MTEFLKELRGWMYLILGVACAPATSTDGVAIDCWKVGQ